MHDAFGSRTKEHGGSESSRLPPGIDVNANGHKYPINNPPDRLPSVSAY